jgi:calreticulin
VVVAGVAGHARAASKPADWNDEDDGDWEPTMIGAAAAPSQPYDAFQPTGPARRAIRPPACRPGHNAAAAAAAAAAENPAPKMIPNPEYGGDVYAYEFEALGFDLWTVNNGTIFDNVLVCDDIKYAEAFAASTWGKFKDTEKEAKEKFDKPSEPPSPPPADDDKDL